MPRRPRLARPLLVVALAGATVLALASSALHGAPVKEFEPGDLRACNAARCAAIRERDVLALLAAFYYSETSPPTVAAPRRGAALFELRFRNGYVTGVVAGPRLDRFLSFGVHIGHFRRGTWYRVPARVARLLRALTSEMPPLRVTPAVVRRSR